ncbi:MAG: AbgT family transporter [Bacilli bacterium]
MKKLKIKEKISLHPVMLLLILSLVTIVISGVLSWFNVQATYNQMSLVTHEYQTTTEAVNSLFSLRGLKYIFTSTVSNFANYAVLSHLIIILFGIGIMEKSGFLKTVITLLTKKAQKTTVTFVLVVVCLISSIVGDLSYLIMIPLSALLFLYGKRNPAIGIITAFAALTCGSGISILLTSVDSSLMSLSLINAQVLFGNYSISPYSFILIMFVALIILAFIITNISENVIAKKLPKYEFGEETLEEDLILTKKKMRGLLFAGFASFIYLIMFIYNIIPGLPFSGNLLDYSQHLYIDKLFSFNSFFTNGFVFIVAVLFIILGLCYGIGAKTINNNKEFIDSLSHSLNGIGKILVMIFASATFISIFKQTNIGSVITVGLTNLIGSSSFSGLPLLILLFFVGIIATLFLPNSITKWTIIATSAVPVLMNVGVSPEFAQVAFRFGESVTMGLTPIFAYFVVYLAYLEKYSQEGNNFKLSKAFIYQLPYSLIVGLVLLGLIIIWYLIGLPLGIGAGVSL